MKSIAFFLFCLSLIAVAEESYLFTFAGDYGSAKKRIEGHRLHSVREIERIETPKVLRIFASHQGLGRGRDYQIQIDLAENVEERWHPKLKLREDVITTGIGVSYSNNEDWPSALTIESDDVEKIKKWTGILVELMKVAEEDVYIDLAKGKQGGDPEPEDESGNDGITLDTKWRLNGTTEWQLHDGPLVSIRESESEGTSFHDKDGRTLFKLGKGKSLEQAALSAQRKTLMFNVGNDDGFGGALLRVSMQGAKPKFEQVFSYPVTPLFKGDRWWVRELGAVSDDGNIVVLKIGWESPKRKWISYEWQTWSIREEKRLGRGLQITHGAESGK
jgi:hypothetical protein